MTRFTGSDGLPPLTYRNLADGRHVFKVVAVDQDGVQDPTPARKRFRV